MSLAYDTYLQEHIANVRKGYDWLYKNLPEVLMLDEYRYDNILTHDASKYEPEEYLAYDAYFYGKNRSYGVLEEYNLAWLRHQHQNPHHWQYWVLINDEDGVQPLDIPYPYLIEMICDWWSFSWKSGNPYEIFDWYEKKALFMILSNGTRALVEWVLSEIKENCWRFRVNEIQRCMSEYDE